MTGSKLGRATAAEVAAYCTAHPNEVCAIAEMLPHERAEYVYAKLHPQPFDAQEFERAMQALVESADRRTAVPTDYLEELALYLQDLARTLGELPVGRLPRSGVDRLLEARTLLENVRAFVSTLKPTEPTEPTLRCATCGARLVRRG